MKPSAPPASEAAPKRRMPAGERHWNSRLSEPEVLEMRDRWDNERPRPTQAELAAEHNLSQCTVSQIVNRKIWRHLP